VNLRELKEIFRLVEKTDFTEVEIVQGDLRLKIERGKPSAAHAGVPVFIPAEAKPAAPPPSYETSPAATAPVEEPSPKAEAAAPLGHFVTSPFVGTFYRSPSPDSDPYVQMGQIVKKGQPLCIVEAMKLMNEIESDFDGKIAEIYVENAKPVEFGEKLFRIEPLS
jgi:acetyl-CoA carboxylase biotin carboxyl carrier protein